MVEQTDNIANNAVQGSRRIIRIWIPVATLLLISGCLPGSLTPPNLISALASSSPSSGSSSSFSFVSSVPSSGQILPINQDLQITFSNTVVPMSCSVDANTDLAMPGAITLNYSGSIVTATPPGAWTSGIGRRLILSGCEDATTGARSGAYLIYQLPAGIMYIAATGIDGNDGLTPSTPMLNIITAANACIASPCAILARGGTYANQLPITNPPAPFVVIGGYDATFATWNPTANPTIFLDTSGTVGSAANPAYALLVQNAPNAILSYIQAKAAADGLVQYPSAIWILDSVASLQNVTATGCSGGSPNCDAAAASRAVVMDGSTTLSLLFSSLDGGECVGNCATIALTDHGAGPQTLTGLFSSFKGGAATGVVSNSIAVGLSVAKNASLLEGNVIAGGTARNTWGISASTFGGSIERNFFSGGAVVIPGGEARAVDLVSFASPNVFRSNIVFGGYVAVATGTVVTIYWTGSNGAIYNNLFDGGYPGTGNISHSYFMSGSRADIQNNIFTGWPGALHNRCIEFMPSSYPGILNNNAFYNCNAPAYDGTDYDTIDPGGVLATSAHVPVTVDVTNSGNLISTTAPGWISQDYASLPAQFNFDYHFRTNGKALCSITRGGLALLAGEQDATFVTRTAPWSMGPYEYDGACQ